MNTNEKPWLVAVSAGQWQVSGIRAALANELQVLALDGDPNAVGMAIATKSEVVDIRDPDAVISAVESSGVQPAGVVSFVSEVGMEAAAALREHYHLAGPNYELTYALTNKVRQREIWDKAKVPGPHWRAFRSVEKAMQCASEIGYPCIVKPSDSAGSRGVTKLTSKNGLEKAAHDALGASRSCLGLIETYMIGTEYAIETFGDGQVIHVLAVTEKGKVPGTKGTVAQQLATPDVARKADVVANAAVHSLSALGYLAGPGHTEVILDDDDNPGLVETAGRGGGFMVFERLVEKVSGYDIVAATALQAVGQTPAAIDRKNLAVTLRFFPSRSGIVTKLEGFSEANRIPGVEAGPFVELGEQVGSVVGDGDRLGYILSEGNTPAEAKDAADRAESLIHIEVV